MKKTICLIAILSFASISYGQKKYAVKAGANYNAEIVDHKLGKINYPSYEAQIERMLGQHWSVSAGFNYSVRIYNLIPDYVFFTGYNIKYINRDKALLLETRWYPQTNTKGFFINAGTSLISSSETRESMYNGEKNSSAVPDYLAMNIFAGIGLKYPICERVGVEMNMSITPSMDLIELDYGTAGFIKSGAKVFYTF